MIDFERMRYLMQAMPDLLWKVSVAQANATRTTSTITGMPHGGGQNHQEDGYINLAEIRDVYREAEAELEGMRKELNALLENYEDPRGKAYLRYRYINGRTLAEIAEAEGRDRTTVFRIIKHAECCIMRAQNA